MRCEKTRGSATAAVPEWQCGASAGESWRGSIPSPSTLMVPRGLCFFGVWFRFRELL